MVPDADEIPNADFRGYITLPGPTKEFLPWVDYVYLWVCQAPGGTYVKIGVTNNPDRRAREFRTNSPWKACHHFICQCPDRATALKLEATLLRTFRAYKARGEWVRIPAGKLDAFVGGCTAAARKEVSPAVEFRDHQPRKPNGEKYKDRQYSL